MYTEYLVLMLKQEECFYELIYKYISATQLNTIILLSCALLPFHPLRIATKNEIK